MISVILAARNEERLMGRAIRSILEQTFRDLELIVVDNNSTDGTVAVARRFASEDPRVRLMAETTPGAYAARNRAVRESRYRWIAVQDADDVSHPERLERLAELVTRDPRIVLAGSWGACYSETEGIREPFHHATSDLAIRCQLRVGPSPFIHSTVLYRKDAFERVGGYPAGFSTAEDYALTCLLAGEGRVANLPRLLGLYRHQERPAGSDFRLVERRETLELRRRYLRPATRLDEWILRATASSRRRRARERVALDWPPELVRRLGLEEAFARCGAEGGAL